MKNLNRPNGSRAARATAVAIVVAAAIAATSGLAGRGYAAPPGKAYKAGYAHKEPRFKEPKLRHGLLTIKGTRAGDTIALRLKAGDPGILQVDVGDNGSADFSFARARVAQILVRARAGDDLVRIDDANGVCTDTTPTTISGGSGNDRLSGGRGNETFLGGSGDDSIDGNAGNDLALVGAGDDTLVWDPGDGSDTTEGQSGLASTRCASTAPVPPRRSTCRPTAIGSGSSATSPPSRWTRMASSGSTSTPSVGRMSSPSTT